MQYIADFHVHSPHSRATSKESTPAGLAGWARIKGIHLVGTGDFTHPAWRKRLGEELVEAEPGFFRLRGDDPPLPLATRCEPIPVRFVLTTEISSIYKKDGRVRKIHNVIFAPDLAAVDRLCGRLAAIGNIESDGRPILGLDARDLLEIVLETNPDGFLVPAHVWTPWFSLFGAKSGFDSIEDCFGDLTPHVFCFETGLSSDPAMNRLVSALDRFTLISNSDCHSPAKLGREANLFETDFDFFAMRRALQDPTRGFAGTIEFYPEEGKYHYDGHRKCDLCLDPAESRRLGGRCPVCNRPLTIGVHHRVLELADRTEPVFPDGDPGYHSLIPLPEIIGELLGRGPATKAVTQQYSRLIAAFGSEFNILLRAAKEDLDAALPLLGEAVDRMRRGAVHKRPGYDGVFGEIHLFAAGELDRLRGQQSLFGPPPAPPKRARVEETGAGRPGKERQARRSPDKGTQAAAESSPGTQQSNPAQLQAITSPHRYILVTAGPGTGKTYTLVQRIARLLTDDPTVAAATVVITFTNKAADEVRQRLSEAGVPGAETVFVGTFHRFCLDWFRKTEEATVAGPEERTLILQHLAAGGLAIDRASFEEDLHRYYDEWGAGRDPQPTAVVQRYLDELARRGLVDLDGVVPRFVQHCRCNASLAAAVNSAVRHLFVDEFQDLNRSQYELVLLLAEHASVFAIGDPDQAIYGFRGADLEHFFDFGRRTIAGQPVEQLTLTDNYRSAPPILAAAGAVIAHNRQRASQQPVAVRHPAAHLEYHRTPSARAEAQGIVERIEGLAGGISHFSIDSGRANRFETELGFGDIAVLCRLRAQAEPVIAALRERGIPVQVVGDRPFWATAALAPLYYRLLAMADIASAAEAIRLCTTVDGIGAATRRHLEQLVLDNPGTAVVHLLDRLAAPARTTLEDAFAELDDLREQLAGRPVEEIVTKLAHDCGIAEEDSRRLTQLAAPFGTDLAGFAGYLKRNYEAVEHDPRLEGVAVMTIHAAKGLEFAAVFVLGLEEGLFPYLDREPCDIEEERRLFYVALTRAERCLFLSSAERRTIHGTVRTLAPSRFLAELPAGSVEHTTTRRRPAKRRAQQLSLF